MIRLVRPLTVLSTAVLALTAPSCAASLDLDGLRVAEGTTEDASAAASSAYDLQFTAKSMGSHVNELFELRVVDKDNHVQAKVVYASVAAPDFNIYMKSIVPKLNPPYRLDFWADHNTSGNYEGIVGGINEKDHAWRRRLVDPLSFDLKLVGNRYELNFVHDTNFTDLYTDLNGNKFDGKQTLLDCRLNVQVAPAYVGKTMEIRVVDKATARLVGLFRRGDVPSTFAATVTGVVDEETLYEVSAYVDVNADGKYSPAADPPDPSWRVELTSAATGLAGDLDIAVLPVTSIDTGER